MTLANSSIECFEIYTKFTVTKQSGCWIFGWKLLVVGAIAKRMGAEQRWEPLCKRTLDQSNMLTPPTLTLAQLLKNPIQKPGAAAEDVPESSDAYWNLSAATPLSEKSPADVTNLS